MSHSSPRARTRLRGAARIAATLLAAIAAAAATPPATSAAASPYSVKLGSPGAGATVSGRVRWSCSTSDDPGTDTVKFYVDGVRVLTEYNAPFGDSPGFWSSRTVANGSHQLKCVGVKLDGTTKAEASATVTVANPAMPPAAAPALPPAPGATVFNGDFETGTFSQWSSLQRRAPDRAQVVTGPVRQGRYAGRFEARQGDDVYGCCRSEVSYGRLASMVVREGDERIVTWSTMFDPSWQAYPGDWQIFHQWHTESGSPPLSLNVMGETIYLGSYGYGRTPVGKLERGIWHDFELRVKFSSRAASGYVELLDRGKVVLPRRPFAALKGGGAYLKMGLYRRPTIAARQVVYHDRVKVARP